MNRVKRLIVEIQQPSLWQVPLICIGGAWAWHGFMDRRLFRMKTHRAGTLLILAAVLGGCGGRESRWAGNMSDSAGVTIVSNTEVGIWAAGEEWTFEEELRIGAVEGAPEYEFGEVSRLAVDSKGRIFVLDGQAQHIQVYSPDGIYEQTIGARGGGPGELRSAMALLIGPGDTLLVPDGMNLRFNRYAPDGSSAGSFRMVLEEGRPMGFRTTASGMIAEQMRPLMLPGQPAAENPTDVIVLLAIDGSVTDTLMTFPSGELIGPGGVTVYAPEPAWDLTDELRLIFGVSDDYRIQLFSGGQLERIVTKPFEREPVADRHKEAIMSEMERRWAGADLSAEVRAQLRDRFQIADFFPAFGAVVAGPLGTIWVQRLKSASELSAARPESFTGTGAPEWNYMDIGTPEWEVLDPEGRFLGVVTMPRRFTPTVFRGDKLYGVWRDEFGVQYVVRLRIVGDLGPGAAPGVS